MVSLRNVPWPLPLPDRGHFSRSALPADAKSGTKRSACAKGIAMLMLSLFGMLGKAGAEDDRTISLRGLKSSVREERICEDLDNYARYRLGLRGNLAFVRRTPALFPPLPLHEEPLLTTGQKDEARTLWSSTLDYYCALDSLGAYHSEYRKLKIRNQRHGSFVIAYGAFLAQYRHALEFIARVDNNPALAKVLDEEMPELGVEKGSYSRFRFRFLNVARATEFTALEVVCKTRMKDPGEYAEFQTRLREDAEAVWKQTGKSSMMTLRNAGRIVKNAGFTAYFPIQRGVADWMGSTKVYRRGDYLVTDGQTAAMAERLQPGDILLTRREWHLSNIGLPGFWTHALIYIGTPGQRRQFFADGAADDYVRSQGLAGGGLEELLERDYPEAYRLATTSDEAGNPPRIIEAIAPGVVFRSLQQGAHSDSVAALRPRLERGEIAAAIHRAFRYSGRPYDYNFDFQTDAALVCSELVYKAYEPANGYRGLQLPLTKVAGRFVLPPNLIAKMVAEDWQNPRKQLDFVFFFDGNERGKVAEEADLQTFLKTWQRPKWRSLAKRIGDAASSP